MFWKVYFFAAAAAIFSTGLLSLEPEYYVEIGGSYTPVFDLKELIKTLFENAKNGSPESQNSVILFGRMLISAGKIEDIVENGFIPLAVELLDSKNDTVQLEATKFLTVLSYNSTDTVPLIMNENALPYFLKNLKSANEEVVDFSLKFIFNLVLNYPDFRVQLNNLELVQNIRILLDAHSESFDIVFSSTSVIIALLQNQTPSLPIIKEMVPIIGKLISYKNSDISGKAALSLAIIINSKSDGWNIEFEDVDIEIITRLLNSDTEMTQLNALFLINVMIGDEGQKFINHGILHVLPKLLKSSNQEIVKNCVKLIDKLLKPEAGYIKEVLKANLLPLIIHLSSSSASSLEIQLEAVPIITMFAFSANKNQISSLIGLKVIRSLCEILKEKKDEMLVQKTVVAILIILHKSESQKCLAFNQLLYGGGINELEELGTGNIYPNNHYMQMTAKSMIKNFEEESEKEHCRREATW